MVNFSYTLSITGTYRLRFLVGKTEGAAVGRHSSTMHTCADDASTTSVWAAPRNKIVKRFLSKRTETSLHKRFLKRNLAHIGMAQCMNALAEKQEVRAHSDMHSITWPHYSITIPT